MTFVPGALVGDVWQVEEILGKGGTGSVYRCHNLHAQRIRAAIKLLASDFKNNQNARKSFLREAEILYTIDHPNVVKVSNVHLDAAQPYIEMEFVDGKPLNAVVAERGAVPPETVLDWARQMAGALAYLHRKKIYHRDIKPQNVLLREDGTLKVVDFGMATEQRNEPSPSEPLNFGTVAYCPPEWARSQELTPTAWDLYAVGVILYELLTGTVAFPGPENSDESLQDRAVAIMEEKQRIQFLDPGGRYHPALREIVQSLTCKDVEQRIPDAKALLARLERVDDVTWTPPEPVAPPEPAGGSLVQHVALVGGLILVAGLAAFVGVVAAGFVLMYAMGINPFGGV